MNKKRVEIVDQDRKEKLRNRWERKRHYTKCNKCRQEKRKFWREDKKGKSIHEYQEKYDSSTER